MQADIAVIGQGLIGSAAAAYLVRDNPGRKVVLIGPGEPEAGQEALVYASHYDAGRVQRIIGLDSTWTRLNLESVQAYPALEAETGIRFHEGVGCLYVSPHGSDAYLDRVKEDEASFDLRFSRHASAEELSKAVPEYRFPEGSVGMLEDGPAGLIRPRKMLEAQVARFRSRGGEVILKTVIKRETVPGGHLLHLEDGTSVHTARVLVAAGSFVNFHGLLPRLLDISVKGETIILAEVSDVDAERLSKLPTLLYERFQKDLDGIYLIGPLQYPDGRWYVKMGLNLEEDRYFTTLAEVQQWFRTPSDAIDEGALPRIVKALRAIMPGVEFTNIHLKRCIIHRTPSLRQYIGNGGAEGLTVVAGCNGYSAMCSDALGRLSAHYLMHSSLPDGYDEELFRPVFVA